jgi:hypothetical protein
MGMAWPTPLIQLLATSEDQVDNVYRPLQAMARGPRLKNRMLVREGFIRLRDDDGDPDQNRIDVVTSSALSRLGNPITFAMQDETQLYTTTNKLVSVARTQRRGAAAMGGRTVETTNCFDPSQDSTAQQTYESTKKDIFKFYEPPPADLKYTATRRAAPDPLVQLQGLAARRSARHQRRGRGAARARPGRGRAVLRQPDRLRRRLMDGRREVGSPVLAERNPDAPPREVPDGTPIVLGFDGSDTDDWTGIRAQTAGRLPVHADLRRRPADVLESGRAPRPGPAPRGGRRRGRAVRALQVVRMYADPPDWKTEIDGWAASTARRSSCAGRPTASPRCTPRWCGCTPT